jgi:hypothetical protein
MYATRRLNDDRQSSRSGMSALICELGLRVGALTRNFVSIKGNDAQKHVCLFEILCL